MKKNRRVPARVALGAVAALAAVALFGAVSAGHAGTTQSLSVVLTGTPSVTRGQNVGYSLLLTNTGANNLSNPVITDRVAGATFDSASSPLCSGQGETMTCSIGNLAAGASFSLDFAFTTPASGSSVSNVVQMSVDPQTPNSTNNRKTDLFFSNRVDTTLLAVSQDALQLFAKRGDDAHTNLQIGSTNPESTDVKIPPGLSAFGVATSINDDQAPGPGQITACTNCPVANISIPASVPVTSSIFTVGNPIGWTIKLDASVVPSNFKLASLLHDGNVVPACALTPLSVSSPVCWTTLNQDKKAGLTAIGVGLTNGSYWFG
jgi:uncharacterized repeat protein (TIGR01451 family)